MNEKEVSRWMSGEGYKSLLRLVKKEPEKTALAILETVKKAADLNVKLTLSLICNVALLFLLYA